jgi:hypothetical protein
MLYMSNTEKGSSPDGSLSVVRCLWNEQSICRCFNKWRGWAVWMPQETTSTPWGYYNKGIITHATRILLEIWNSERNAAWIQTCLRNATSDQVYVQELMWFVKIAIRIVVIWGSNPLITLHRTNETRRNHHWFWGSPSKLVGLWLLESKVQIPVPVWQENKSETK